jgi:hypothetical protein
VAPKGEGDSPQVLGPHTPGAEAFLPPFRAKRPPKGEGDSPDGAAAPLSLRLRRFSNPNGVASLCEARRTAVCVIPSRCSGPGCTHLTARCPRRWSAKWACWVATDRQIVPLHDCRRDSDPAALCVAHEACGTVPPLAPPLLGAPAKNRTPFNLEARRNQPKPRCSMTNTVPPKP